IRVDLEEHLARAEAFLQEARAAVDARFGDGPLAPFIDNPGLCRRCDHFGKSCSPPLDFGAGARMIADERLIQLGETCEKTKEAHDRYARAWKELTKAVRGVELGVMGPFQLEGKWQRNTKLVFPDE